MLSVLERQCELRFVDAVVIDLVVVEACCLDELVRWEEFRAPFAQAAVGRDCFVLACRPIVRKRSRAVARRT